MGAVPRVGGGDITLEAPVDERLERRAHKAILSPRYADSWGAGHENLRASVGSTEASNGRLARVGVVGPARAKMCRLPVLWFGEDEKRAADFLTTTVTGQGIY